LRVGDIVRSRLSGKAKVTGLALAYIETTMYNFSVDVLCNYAVGDGEWLVHNTNAPGEVQYNSKTRDNVRNNNPETMRAGEDFKNKGIKQ